MLLLLLLLLFAGALIGVAVYRSMVNVVEFVWNYVKSILLYAWFYFG